MTDLQKIKDLREISRTSVERFRSTHKSISKITKEPEVNFIIEGSRQKYFSIFRQRVKLIQADQKLTFKIAMKRIPGYPEYKLSITD